MPTLIAHMTKLEAVNQILWTIGERAVQSLSSGLADAEDAERFLDESNRQIQAKGWNFNTEKGVELSTNASNEIVVGVDILRIDTSNGRSYRKQTTPRRSGHIEVALRRSADDTQWLLWDVVNQSETWTDVDTLTVDQVRLHEFANLPPEIQRFVWAHAAKRFQTGAMASRVLHEVSNEELAEAMTDALNYDESIADSNAYRELPHLWNATHRNNPFR